MQFKHAILGGTFDHLHAGHKFFISAALKSAEKVSIGLVRMLLEKKAFENSVEAYEERKSGIETWLKEESINSAEIIPIDDIYGNSLSDKSVDAIFVTEHGFSNAELINEKRAVSELPALEIQLVLFLKGEDGKIISSTRIRAGEINRAGKPYMNYFVSNLNLPAELREVVRNTPSGTLVKSDHDLKNLTKNKFVIAVGDITSERLVNINSQADISVIDFKTRRGEITPVVNFDYSEKNPSGSLYSGAVKSFSRVIEKSASDGKNYVFHLEGEEDLFSLPSVLLAPLGATVLYGMPEEGVIAVNVTEEKKEQVAEVLEKFNKSTTPAP